MGFILHKYKKNIKTKYIVLFSVIDFIANISKVFIVTILFPIYIISWVIALFYDYFFGWRWPIVRGFELNIKTKNWIASKFNIYKD